MTQLSVIIPCYNEEAVIRKTYDRLSKAVGSFSHELIFINDGSRDNTLTILREIASADNHVRIINFSRNFGHQPAVTAGINNCHGEVAVIIDADLQDPPELIPDMIVLQQKEQCNVVYAVRKKRKGDSFFKRLTARWFYKTIYALSDVHLPLDTGDFRLIDRKVIDEFNKLGEKNKYIRGLISWVGFKQCPFYYDRDARLDGETKYPLSKMIRFATTGLLYFSKKPLLLSITLGFISILIGLGLAVFSIISYLMNWHTVPGWASIMITVVFFGGVQLLSIGVIGLYLGSIFDEVKGRPQYIISDKYNLD